MKKILPHIFIFVFLVLLSGSLVHAQQGSGNTGGPQGTGNGVNVPPTTIENPFRGTGNSLMDFFKTLVNNIVLPLGEVLAVLAFIYTGFLYVTAQGNPGKVKDAHNAFLNTVIGTAVLLGAWAIANVVENTIKSLQ